ncbi:MAG TPA: TetR family transcriptional regulator [Xanthomonadaceae bacterium]|nr:TetR family transcriptional regulator [Xanthomonadaceae bacterium]
MPPAITRPAVRDDRDRRVHDAVHSLLAEQGMRLSMDAVAARAGCSKQTLYARYGNKQNLLKRVMREHFELTTAPLDRDDGDIRECLVAFAEQHLDQLNRPDVVQTCRLIDAESHQFPDEARQIYHDGVARLQHRLAQWLQQAIDRGQLRHDDPHFMAELLLAMIVGLDFERQRFHTPHRTAAQARRAWAEFSADSFLRAFAPGALAPAASPNSNRKRSFSR